MALVTCHQVNGLDPTQFKEAKELQTFERETGESKEWRDITYEYS